MEEYHCIRRFFVMIIFLWCMALIGCGGGGGGGSDDSDDNGTNGNNNGGDITVDKFGGKGTEDGKFGGDMHGIAIDDDGMVYVSDTGNQRIQKFTANGDFVDKWDFIPGTQPYGMVAYDNRLYICDVPDNVQVFDLEGNYISTWYVPDTNNRSGGMAVVDIDVSEDEDGIAVFYVLDNIDRSVKKFNETGTFLGSFQVDTVDPLEWGPLGIAVYDDKVYVTDAANNKVNEWEVDGTYLQSWGTQGDEANEFNSPTGIALMGGNAIIVGDINLYPTFSRIQKFGLNGNYKSMIKPYIGDFYPRALAVNDKKGKIYICHGNFEILVVDTF